MMALDTFNDNLCLWRCIAVPGRARPDRSTAAARQPAQSFFNTPGNEKTSLDELDAAERFLNAHKPLSEWVGIRVYEPERTAAGETVWHIHRNAPPRIEDVLTISAFDDHAFLIKDFNRLAGVYRCGQYENPVAATPEFTQRVLGIAEET